MGNCSSTRWNTCWRNCLAFFCCRNNKEDEIGIREVDVPVEVPGGVITTVNKGETAETAPELQYVYAVSK
jgi:hypothetical protein